MYKPIYVLVIFSLLVLMGEARAIAPEEEAEGFEPEIIIKPSEDGRIEEFRKHGKVFMIKVTPRKGKPYFLVDADGDGSFDHRATEFSPQMLIPAWEIFTW